MHLGMLQVWVETQVYVRGAVCPARLCTCGAMKGGWGAGEASQRSSVPEEAAITFQDH